MSILYSHMMTAFTERLKRLVDEILQRELGRKSASITLVAFEHPTRLGYFDSSFMEIGIHKKFLNMSLESPPNKLLMDLLRHEIAHYLTFITFGQSAAAHGAEFHSICKACGWGPLISAATLEESLTQNDETSDRILAKIQKLLALANSSNAHEAESAALKSHELLIKHNLTASQSDGEEFAVVRLFKEKKLSTKASVVSTILRLFFVTPVVNHHNEHAYLEIFGTKSNVTIAEHVGLFLYRELDFLYEKARQQNPLLKGLASKNSFFRGVGEGYCSKITSQRQTFSSSDQRALTTVESNNAENTSLAYPRLRKAQPSMVRNCTLGSTLGREEGRRLQIASSLDKGASQSPHLLSKL